MQVFRLFGSWRTWSQKRLRLETPEHQQRLRKDHRHLISYAWGSLPHEVATTWRDEATEETLYLKLGKEWGAKCFLDELVAGSAFAAPMQRLDRRTVHHDPDDL